MTNIASMQCVAYTRAMSAALGAYLKTLRVGRELEPKDVLKALTDRLRKPVDHSRLWRAENGSADRWPDGDFLTALLDIVGGDLADVSWIQAHPNSTAAQGEERARRRIEEPPMSAEEAELTARLLSLTGDRRQAAILMLDQLLAAEEAELAKPPAFGHRRG